MTESLSVKDLAETVQRCFPNDVEIRYLDNPRVEHEEHYYNVTHTGLVDLGLVPHLLSDTLITSLFDVAKRHAHRVKPQAMEPRVHWRASASPVRQG